MPGKASMIIIIAALLGGCSTLSPPLQHAATQQGTADAGVKLPAWPARCAGVTPHASIDVGAEALTVLKRERDQLDRANADKSACAGFYINLRSRLANPGRK